MHTERCIPSQSSSKSASNMARKTPDIVSYLTSFAVNYVIQGMSIVTPRGQALLFTAHGINGMRRQLLESQ